MTKDKKPTALITWADHLLSQFIRETLDLNVTMSPSDPFDLAVFPGGADICPILYGEPPHPTYSGNLKRDFIEIRRFKNLPTNLPKIGICRGGQLLNVLCGGAMYQDVDNHCGNHKVFDLGVSERTGYNVTSTHHQMMKPSDSGYVFLGAAVSTEWNTYSKTIKPAVYNPLYHDPEFPDVEGVFYGEFNSMCFQPHPEYGHKETVQIFMEYYETLIKVDVNKHFDKRTQ